MNKKQNKYFDKQNLVCAAKIISVDGNKGGLMIKFAAENYDIDVTEPALVEFDGCLVSFFFDENQTFETKKGVVIKFDTVNSVDDAMEFVGKEIFVLKDDLIEYEDESDDVSDDDFLFMDYNVIEKKSNSLIGKIIDFNPIPGNPLIVISTADNKEILIPYAAISIINQNDSEKLLEITIPDGILDLN